MIFYSQSQDGDDRGRGVTGLPTIYIYTYVYITEGCSQRVGGKIGPGPRRVRARLNTATAQPLGQEAQPQRPWWWWRRRRRAQKKPQNAF